MSRAAAAILLSLIAAGSAAAAPGDALYVRHGHMVAAGDGARLSMYCMGIGSPAVVFESGWGDWAPAWALVQPRVAKFTRACSYDRAGVGFSTPGPMPRTSVRIADELHAALRNAGIRGPYILVGHAFGADHVRAFADRYMDYVAGMVLVEGDSVDLEPKEMQDADHASEAQFVERLRACRDAISAGNRDAVLPAPPGGRARPCARAVFFRGLPEAAWSKALNAKLIELGQTKAAMYDAFISEMENMAWDEAWIAGNTQSLGDRPLRVLTTGNHGVGHLPAKPDTGPAHSERERKIGEAQARWLTLSTNAKQIFVPDSSEYIPFDRPDAVVAAIREVYDQSGARHGAR